MTPLFEEDSLDRRGRMTPRVITWDPAAESLGEAVVAIGVFDGVHLGHQALLADTVADAQTRGVQAVALTFDRDPDQVVSPDTAAPQLLPLADKDRFIAETGIDVILVVPFTEQTAQLAPEAFVSSVLLSALKPLSVHVGSDFRFGHMASGDVFTLARAGLESRFEVVPHDLVTAEGQAVTSTRIRALVAQGQVAEAATLLGRPTRVAGTVHRGRGEGASLGFPTANMVPVPFAALPGDGVYAGRATLSDGSGWAAAISVGTPPMFPDAKDYLEAHLLGFEGDLYDQPITLEFWERLRDQQSYADLASLTAAIAADVDHSLDIAGFTDEEIAESGVEVEPTDEDGTPIVDDSEALEAAEAAVAKADAPDPFEQPVEADWTALRGDVWLDPGVSSAKAFMWVQPLEAAGIPFIWDPYDPEDMPGLLRPGCGRPFGVLVPEDRLAEAQRLMDAAQPEAAQEYEAETCEEDTSYDETALGVDDPAVLEAAEQAVRGVERDTPFSEPAHWTEADGDWELIASDLPFDKPRLLDIDAALFAAGIPAAWDPYRPDQSPLMHLRLISPNVFSLSVPSEQAETARAILGEHGVAV